MYLLDTDIVIYALKGRPAVVAALGKHAASPMAISVITLMELYYGAQRSASPEANLARVRTLEHEFQVLPAGVNIAATFGNLKARMAVPQTTPGVISDESDVDGLVLRDHVERDDDRVPASALPDLGVRLAHACAWSRRFKVGSFLIVVPTFSSAIRNS